MKISSVGNNSFLFNNVALKSEKKVSNPIKRTSLFLSSVTASAVAAATMATPVTTKKIEEGLESIGYEKGNVFVKKNFSKKEMIPFMDTFKDLTPEFLPEHTKYTKEDINEFKKFLNADTKLGNHILKNYFPEAVNVFSVLKYNNKTQVYKDKNLYSAVMNLIMSSPKEDEHLSILKYKGKTYDLGVASDSQKYLRENYKDKSISPSAEVKTFIDNVASFLDKQVLPEKMELYRGERYGVFENVKIGDKSINLGEMMQSAAQSKDYNEIEKVKEFVLNNEITVTQPAFMSTSANKDTALERKNGIFWIFETEPNTKGAYLEGLNTSFYTFQDEVLLQKNSKIKLMSCDYNSDENIWCIRAKVSNT